MGGTGEDGAPRELLGGLTKVTIFIVVSPVLGMLLGPRPWSGRSATRCCSVFE
jgi:hypothetical protein